MDESLFELFQQEHPVEVQYILDHGVPDGHTFLSYLQDLCQKTYNDSLKDQQEKDYKLAVEKDVLVFQKEELKTKLANVHIEFTKDDQRALMLKLYDKEAFSRAEEKQEMMALLSSLRTDRIPLQTYIDGATRIFSYMARMSM